MSTLDLIMPVYNERIIIEKVISEWNEELSKYKSELEYNFIICEDGSTDGTKEILNKIKEKYKLILNQRKNRRSYGEAIIHGINSSSAKYILCVDSDGQCDPKDFNKFWKNREKADILVGWRRKRADQFSRKVFSFLFKMVFKLLFTTPLHDPSVPFVLFKRDKILPFINLLKYFREGLWWGFVGLGVKKNLKIREIPIRHNKKLVGNTHIYHIFQIPSIGYRNILALLRLKFS